MKQINAKKDPRFIRTVGKLIRANLLEHKTLQPFSGQVTLSDALWAGKFEPRILELIPAIVLKKKKLFKISAPFPNDLEKVINRITHGKELVEFRGVEPRLYMQWVERL